MRHLAQVSDHACQPVELKSIVEEAYRTASRTPGVQPGTLRFDEGPQPIVVQGDFAALTDAFGEIILNALQANPAHPEVNVHCALRQNPTEHPTVVVDVSDNGVGFQPETMKDATQPFFGTRSVGPGLGLAVAKQVIERHSGTLEIVPAEPNREGSVRVQLPVQDGAG
jgi:signal transduction histidine kinase